MLNFSIKFVPLEHFPIIQKNPTNKYELQLVIEHEQGPVTDSGEVFLSYFGIIWGDREGCSRRWALAAHGKTRQIRIYHFFSVLFHFPFIRTLQK